MIASSPNTLRPRAAPARQGHAERLWLAASAVLALMPVAMVLANRSSLLVLGIATALAFAALAFEQGWPWFAQRAKAGLARSLGLAALAFLAWSVASLAWSEAIRTSLSGFGEFWFAVGAACFLALVLPDRIQARAFRWLAVSFLIAAVLILVELATGVASRRWLGGRAAGFIFNRPALTLLVLSIPLIFWLHRRKRGLERGLERWLAFAVAALGATAIVMSDSGAALLGLVLAGCAALAAAFARRLALALAALAVIASMSAAPFLGSLADRLIPPSVHQTLTGSHSRERVDLWLSFEAAVREQPWLGGGFAVSARMRETTVAARVPRERWELLAIGHPHNAPLQIWAELGAVGAGLALIVLLLLVARLGRLPDAGLVPALALFTGVLAVSLVGHGAWQGWWPAAVGASIIWLQAAMRLERETA